MPRKALKGSGAGLLPFADDLTMPAREGDHAQPVPVSTKGDAQVPPRDGVRIVLLAGGAQIHRDDNDLISLTEIWEANGRPENKRPKDWFISGGGEKFVGEVGGKLNVGKSHIWKSRRGKHLGGTWAHRWIAQAYSQYINGPFHIELLEAFQEWTDAKVDAAAGRKVRAREKYARQGKSLEWIKYREESKEVRNGFTSTLNAHGVTDKGYPMATNGLTLGAIGRTPIEVKKEKGLAKSAVTRDHLSLKEIMAIGLAEITAGETITRQEAWGNEPCIAIARHAGKTIGDAVRSLE